MLSHPQGKEVLGSILLGYSSGIDFFGGISQYFGPERKTSATIGKPLHW